MKKVSILLLSLYVLIITGAVTADQVAGADDTILLGVNTELFKGNNSGAILSALASMCFQAATVAGAETPQEKQEGVLNFVGTALQLASQVTQGEAKRGEVIEQLHRLVEYAEDDFLTRVLSRSMLKNGELMITFIEADGIQRDLLIRELSKDTEQLKSLMAELFTISFEFCFGVMDAQITRMRQTRDLLFEALSAPQEYVRENAFA